ncbi:MAG: MBL fold metallo-hydrolase [Solirubrobacterales bacterium]|nr:MBL fold metallo-hydrolase [Solirubrobacterales bacterium]
MKQLADGVWQLSGFPPNAINVYVLEDVLIDASTRHATRRIMRQIAGHRISAHALTHAHPDHQGASHAVCERLGIPFWVGERDADAAENPELIGERQPDSRVGRLIIKTFTGPGHAVDRRLTEGDQVAGFEVLDVPGHSAGHVAYWRAGDGVLVLGDVLNSQDVFTGIPGLREPKPYLTPDPDRNRQSAKRLGALEPKLALFGHGPPVRDTRKLVDFVDSLRE